MKSWPYPIVRVRQKDTHGCGVAAVATLCGSTYERARAECFPKKQKFVYDDMMVTADQMQKACLQLGIVTTLVGWNTDFRAQKLPAILTLAWNPDQVDRTGFIHCVVWSPFTQNKNKRIIDPGIDNRADENYMNLARRSGYHIILATGRAEISQRDAA